MNFRRLTLSVVILVALADFLFYGQIPGVSIALYSVALAAALLWNRPGGWSGPRTFGALLLGGALLQSLVEFNPCNFVVIACLFGLAAVESAAAEAGVHSRLWSQALHAGIRAPVSLVFFLESRTKRPTPAGPAPAAERFFDHVGTVFLAVAIVVPFALLLSAGNAIMAMNFSHLVRALTSVELPSPLRVFFWFCVACVVLPLLLPTLRPSRASLCTAESDCLPDRAAGRLRRNRAVVILTVLNGLFLWTNSVDAIYLWFERRLPSGISYSGYVHEGVFALSATTVLAAATLVWVFDGPGRPPPSPWVRRLSLLWIGQNVLLIAGVALRLALYIQAYELSVLRFHVGSFLALAVASYALLAWRIIRERDFSWLFASNATALFALFYVLQFVDVPSIVARYNVDHWLAHPDSVRIDPYYLKRLGSASWAPLTQLSLQAPDPKVAANAESALTIALRSDAGREAKESWRSWQWRLAARRREMLSTPAPAARMQP